MNIVKIAFSAVLSPLLFACSHPLEIIGEGDVLSATGERNCYLADFQAGKDNCRKNLVMSAYQETYYGVAHKGWEFSHWQNYCTDATNNECSFNIPADAVEKNVGATLPPLVAVFNKTQAVTPVPTPVALYSYSIDSIGNLVRPQLLEGASLERKTVYFGYRDSYSGIRFSCCKLVGGNEAHSLAFNASRSPRVMKVDLGALPLDKGLSRALEAELTTADGRSLRHSSSWQLQALSASALYFDDGATHNVDYSIQNGVNVSNGTRLNVLPGANITSTDPYYSFRNRGGVTHVNGGSVSQIYSYGQMTMEAGFVGKVFTDVGSSLVINGGSVSSIIAWGTTVTIRAGKFGGLYSEENSRVSIAGGSFGRQVNTVSGSYEITGGTFVGGLRIDDPSASMVVKGGKYSAGFFYSHNASTNFTFHGDLTITKPVYVQGNQYESTIRGTLLDGSSLTQTITCFEQQRGATNACDGVRIVRGPR